MKVLNSDIRKRCIDEYMHVLKSIFNHDSLQSLNSKLENNFSSFKKNIYTIYPFYFSSFYPDINEKELYELALCGNLYLTYIMMMDSFIDNEVRNISLLPLQKLNETAIIKITSLFPSNSPFWNCFYTYRDDYVNGLEKEKKIFDGDVTQYSLLDFECITKAKCSIAKCSTSGLAILSNKNPMNDPFILTQDYFHLGLQILDDIQDWKEDYRNKNKSYLLHQVFSDLEFIERLKSVDDKENTLGKYIYFSGITYKLFEKALFYFRESKKSSKDYDVPYWTSFVENYISYCEQLIQKHLENQQTIRSHNCCNNKIYIHNSSISSIYIEALNKGITYLILEHENDYVESNHIMQMPSSENISSDASSILVTGNIFQRTIIIETFLDINSAFNNAIESTIIKKDIRKIIELRMSAVRGGWNYFPGYMLLPPDTDDLAQVIQILVRSNFPYIDKHVDDPIYLLLNYNKNDDGTFKTWILDPSDTSDLQRKLRTATENYWGNFAGRDNEVTANLLYSLSLYNKLKYKDVVLRGIQAIASSQTEKGYWDSIWYWGPFYGTYVATRLLVEYNHMHPALIKTKYFITEHQNDDGGWGIIKSDPLNTALALLILENITNFERDFNPEIFERGLSYLLKEQQKSGSWKKVPFIKMRINEKDLTYSSETVSTAYVLRAISRLFSKYPSTVFAI